MKNAPKTLFAITLHALPALCCGQSAEPSPPPSLVELREIWQPGTTWKNERAKTHSAQWLVASFDEDELTLTRKIKGKRDHVSITLTIGEDLDLTVTGAQYEGKKKRITLRDCSCNGDGWIDRDSLRFLAKAEQRPSGSSKWRPWTLSTKLVPDTSSSRRKRPAKKTAKKSAKEAAKEVRRALRKGTQIEGRRTEADGGPENVLATMRGQVVHHDARWLRVKVTEEWPTKRGMFRSVWEWRFERGDADAKTGNPRWTVVDGKHIRGERDDQRSNWRGYVTWQDGRLEGRYGFDWRHMSKRGLKPGGDELTLPLVLRPASKRAAR
ncbi:MAG: hypothetical protein AB8H80_21070 [Planctomycetota bacterium]